MQRTVSACDCGGVCPVRAASAAMRAGMSPGGRNAGPSMSTTVVSAGTRAAAASRSGRSAGSPASFQVRIDSWSTHRPMTLRRYRTVPSTPASLVKLAARLSSVSTGRSSSRPTSDHVPQEMYAKSLAGGRDRDDGRRGVVRADGPHRHRSRAARRPRARGRAARPGRAAAGAGVLVDARAAPRGRSPTCRVVASSRPVVDALVTSATRAPGQPVAAAGPGPAAAVRAARERRGALRGDQLEHGVERLHLQARAGVELGARGPSRRPCPARRRCARRGSGTGCPAGRRRRRGARSRRPTSRCRRR